MKIVKLVSILLTTALLTSCNPIRVPKSTMDHQMSSMPQNVIPTKSEWKTPETLKPDKKIPISILIRDKSNKPIQAFETVHTKKMHLIIVSKDLSYFSHLHPKYKGNGEFNISTAFPAGGDYQLIAEVTPKGGGDNSVEKHWLHIDGPIPKSKPLIPDQKLTTMVDGLKITLSFDHLMAEMNSNMTFMIRDAKTNKPIKNLQPYLGALGHAVAIKDDLQEYLHIHPMTTKGNGPKVTFMTYFPQKGIYKIWGQFQYQGRIIVAPFIVDVPKMNM
ncbi:hypothetical protein [Bacillus sp. UNC438CL73TsuS30]|uniref:hypothetical protein n=1 Tax=Bacillus sp. UNC438CL73TsuS30 TaxID=1340434 RepID=UPI000478EED0|nr:hypothetical protein [Bacillus sp. UNC438CL73TsuS30]